MDAIAIDTLRERARQGDARAMSVLGRRLLLGLGTPSAPQEGHACLVSAAARGDGEASALLARREAVDCTIGGPVDREAALVHERVVPLPSMNRIAFTSRAPSSGMSRARRTSIPASS